MSPLIKTFIAACILLAISGGFLAAYYLTGRARGYLYYLGIAFIGSAILLFTSGIARYLVIAGTLAAFLMAVIEAVRDTRERIRQFQEEQREREESFAEFLTAVAKKEATIPTVDADTKQAE